MREYSYHLWCSKKHLLLAKTHLDETAEKLYSECNTVCQVSDATRIESEDALRNLLASEEHIADILSQKSIPELRLINDKIRKIRQELALTNLPFRTTLEIDKNAINTVEKARKQVDDIITEIDRYAVEMKQELTGVDCKKCAEDFVAILDAVSVSKPNNTQTSGNHSIGEEITHELFSEE